MTTVKNNGPIIDPALCRCCRAIKKCRILTAEYTWMETKEVYSDMIMDCFGILVSFCYTWFYTGVFLFRPLSLVYLHLVLLFSTWHG